MDNRIFDYRTLLEGAIGNKLQGLLAPKQKFTGLLDFAQSQYGGDIGKGLLAQSGYQPMPTNLGASIGSAVGNADQLKTQRRVNDFSELGAFADLLKTLTPTDSKTDDRWELVQSYAASRDIILSETEAKEIASNLGKGSIYQMHEPTGTEYNILDIALENYTNRIDSSELNQDTQKDVIPLETGETELKNENINKKVESIGSDFATYGWTDSLNVVQEVDDIIKESGGDIAGVGAGAFLPDIFKGTEGRKNRAVLQKLFNIVLKDRSGAAVTEPELDRLKEEFSSGLFKTDQDYINAFKIYKRILNNTISQAKAAYDPRAFDRWVGQVCKWQVGSNQELRNKYD